MDPTAGAEALADVNPMLRPRASMGAAAEAAAHAILADAKGSYKLIFYDGSLCTMISFFSTWCSL